MSAKVLTKLLAVSRAIKEDVKATGRNDFHGYSYLSESDIIEAVRDAMNEQGLVVIPQVDSLADEEVQDRKGNRDAITTVFFTYTFLDAESGESITTKWAGRGDDPSDKGIYKAMTGALKYLLRQTFLIADAKSDPEGDRGTDERAQGRTRNEKPRCPKCNLPLRSNDEGYYCWKKKGGCGWAGSLPGGTEPGPKDGAPKDLPWLLGLVSALELASASQGENRVYADEIEGRAVLKDSDVLRAIGRVDSRGIPKLLDLQNAYDGREKYDVWAKTVTAIEAEARRLGVGEYR